MTNPWAGTAEGAIFRTCAAVLGRPAVECEVIPTTKFLLVQLAQSPGLNSLLLRPLRAELLDAAQVAQPARPVNPHFAGAHRREVVRRLGRNAPGGLLDDGERVQGGERVGGVFVGG